MPGTPALALCARRPCARRPAPAFASAALAANAAADPALPPAPVPLRDLGPTDRAVEVVVATTSNLLNGAIFGALFGFVSGVWSTRSLRGALAEARSNGRSWGAISGVYAGLQTAAKVLRNREDRFNSVVGACGSGAAFTAKAGPRAALQGCASFAALSYLIDMFTSPTDRNEDPLSDEAILRKKR